MNSTKKEEPKKYFFGNVKEIIESIKSNPNIKIFVEANEYWDGVYQLEEDKESDSIEHFDIYDCNDELAVSGVYSFLTN